MVLWLVGWLGGCLVGRFVGLVGLVGWVGGWLVATVGGSLKGRDGQMETCKDVWTGYV